MSVFTAKRFAASVALFLTLSMLGGTSASLAQQKRWPVEKAWQWYRDLGPVAGCPGDPLRHVHGLYFP